MRPFNVVNPRAPILIQRMHDAFRAFTVRRPEFIGTAPLSFVQPEIETIHEGRGHDRMLQQIEIDILRQQGTDRSHLIGRGVMRNDRFKPAGPGSIYLIEREHHADMVRRQGTAFWFGLPGGIAESQGGGEHSGQRADSPNHLAAPGHEAR